jgi:hypothetical protein
MSNLARRANPTAGHVIDTDALAGPWSVTMSEPLPVVGLHEHAGHLLVDLQSPEGSVRMQLTRRDLPLVLKTLIDAVGQLAALAE